MSGRVFRRDRRGRFAATPGQKVHSALVEADAAIARAEEGVREMVAARASAAKSTKRRVRRSALAGAAVGALVPAPAGVKASTARAAFVRCINNDGRSQAGSRRMPSTQRYDVDVRSSSTAVTRPRG